MPSSCRAPRSHGPGIVVFNMLYDQEYQVVLVMVALQNTVLRGGQTT